MLRRSRVAWRCDRKELMLWGNTSVRLPVALHLILQAVSACRQRTHDCVNAWCSSGLEETALKLDQITGSELMCCHGTTPLFFARPPILRPTLWRHWEGRVHRLAAFRRVCKTIEASDVPSHAQSSPSLKVASDDPPKIALERTTCVT